MEPSSSFINKTISEKFWLYNLTLVRLYSQNTPNQNKEHIHKCQNVAYMRLKRPFIKKYLG